MIPSIVQGFNSALSSEHSHSFRASYCSDSISETKHNPSLLSVTWCFRQTTPTYRVEGYLTTDLECSGQQVTQVASSDPRDYNDKPIRIRENQDPVIPRRPVPLSERLLTYCGTSSEVQGARPSTPRSASTLATAIPREVWVGERNSEASLLRHPAQSLRSISVPFRFGSFHNFRHLPIRATAELSTSSRIIHT